MTTLNAAQLTELRQGVTRSTETAGAAVNYTKPEINVALQAIEDYFEITARAALASAIESATPGVFNAAAKRRLVAHYLRQKFDREGV